MNFLTHHPYRMMGGGAAVGTKHNSVGLVTAQGKVIRDYTGAYLPLGMSFFWAMWGMKFDAARTEDNAAYIAPWCEFVRVFGEVGGPGWDDRTIDPRWTDYVEVGQRMTDMLFEKMHMRQMFTIFAGGSGAPVGLTMDKVIRIIRGREEAFLNVEISNEGKLSKADMRELAQGLRREFPTLLVSTTSPTGESFSVESMDLDITNDGEVHTERQQGDEDWRQVRQGCEIMGLPWTKGNGEPPGFESSVAILHDPLRLASLRIVGALSGMVRYVHHTGAGIRGGGAADRARGRAANFWEYDGSGPNRPSLAEAVEKYRAVDSLIPADAPNWNSMKGHWPTTRLTVDAVWSDDAKNIDHGAVRVYGSCSSEGFAGIVFGVRRYVQVMSHFGPWHLQVFDVATGALVYAQAVGIEHEFRLDGDPNIWGSAPSEAGSSRAYLVLGNR